MLPTKEKSGASNAINFTESRNNYTSTNVTDKKSAISDIQTLSASEQSGLPPPQCYQNSELRRPNDKAKSSIASKLQLSTKTVLQRTLKINTSNHGKFSEFSRIFSQYAIELETSHIDLNEIDSDPISVVVHKASQLPEDCMVEDTSLDVADAEMGVNVRWLSQDLPKYIGKPATWRTLLAVREKKVVSIYQGEVFGTIVAPRGDQGFGFDPYFLPDGYNKTLAENKPDEVNARAKAIDAYCQKQVFAKRAPIMDWQGPWQTH